MDNQDCVENGSTTVIDTAKLKEQQQSKNDDYIPPVNDNVIDDERTIEEEENLSENSSNSREIEKLKQESEIPIEKLIMMYKCGGGGGGVGDGLNDSSKKGLIMNDSTDDCDYDDDFDDEEDDDFDDDFDDDDDEEEEEDESNHENNNQINGGGGGDENNQQLNKNSNKKQKTNDLQNLLINNSNSNNCGDDEDDEDFDPNTIQMRRMINIGDEHQASVDDQCLSCKSNNENDDDMRRIGQLVWNPYRLDENDVCNYLKQIQKNLNLGKIKDDELAYTLLNTCDYKIDEAIRQYDTHKQDNDVKVWNEEANEAFEDGYREFGKDFKQIKEKKLTNMSIGQLVSYYYLWKKTERHDVFFNKYKIKKNKHHHLFNPYTTDYMETFMLDNQSHMLSSLTTAPSTAALTPLSSQTEQTKIINNDKSDDCIRLNDSKNLTNNNNTASPPSPPLPQSTTANINPINNNSQLIVN